MVEPTILVTDEFVYIDGEEIPIEEFNFEECPMVAELLGVVYDNQPSS